MSAKDEGKENPPVKRHLLAERAPLALAEWKLCPRCRTTIPEKALMHAKCGWMGQ